MLGKQSGQRGFRDLETTGRLSAGHCLRKLNSQIAWQAFEKLLAPWYHPTEERPRHPPMMMFKAPLLQPWYNLSDPGLEEARRSHL